MPIHARYGSRLEASPLLEQAGVILAQPTGHVTEDIGCFDPELGLRCLDFPHQDICDGHVIEQTQIFLEQGERLRVLLYRFLRTKRREKFARITGALYGNP